MNAKTVIQAIATAVTARANCENRGNLEWMDKWDERLTAIERALPSGSGFDSGTTIDLDKSDAKRITLQTWFHHMNDHGSYDGWTKHSVTVRPEFDGFSITVTGRNRNDIKEYIADTFHNALSCEWE